jgi:hypothetical protein
MGGFQMVIGNDQRCGRNLADYPAYDALGFPSGSYASITPITLWHFLKPPGSLIEKAGIELITLSE